MVQKNPWECIKEQLHHVLTSEAYHNWVARTQYLGLEDARLRVTVPDDATREWMESEYSRKVMRVVETLQLPVKDVVYELAEAGAPASLYANGFVAAPPQQVPAEQPLFPGTSKQLNPRLSFQSFVVGSCNQFAHAASHAVSRSPGKSYNPLFIYGGSGMGKTHLLHAIALELHSRYGGLRVLYSSGERFMNEMVQCIRTDRLTEFQRHYRSSDVLIVDDVHLIAGKERTQEEFFHTFNELYDHQKQIVLSSDALPRQTSNLVERLRSRFEWGLIVDVQAPDLETKMAILDMKAEAEGVRLPEDVRIYLATKTRSNVRELEGALVKLIAYSSVTQEPISNAMAQQVLRSIQPHQERRISIESVIRAVAERHNMTPAQMRQKTNAKEIARPRQIAMYLAKDLTSASLPEIGRAFGGKHHTTVLHSIRKVEELRQADPEINRLIHNVIDSFN